MSRKRPGGGVFYFRNSDGPNWGDRGYGVVSYAYVRTYANDAIWLKEGPPHSEEPLVRFEAERMAIVCSGGGRDVGPSDERLGTVALEPG